MQLNRLLLRTVLALLAAAALTAVIAALTGNTTALWRVVFTCIEAAVAAGAIYRVSLFLKRPRQRPAATVGFASAALAFAMMLIGTWIDTLGPAPQGQILGTAFAIGGLGAVATAALAARIREDCLAAGPATATAAGLTLVTTIVAIWAESDRIGAAAAAGGPVLMIGMVCLVGNGIRERPWRYLGVGMGLIAAVIGVWQVLSHRATLDAWNLYATLTAGAVAVMHANLLMLLNLAAPWKALRMATIAAGFATAVGVAYSAFARGVLEWQFLEEPAGRFTAAAGILAACGTLALVARQRLGRRFAIEAAGTGYTSVTVHCPRCSTKQNAPIGDSPCTGCRLILSIRVGEPRCGACGYCLFDLQEDRCPECGSPIPVRGEVLRNSEATEAIVAT